jgi:hypothetical protein
MAYSTQMQCVERIYAYKACIFETSVRRNVTTLRVRVTCTCTHSGCTAYMVCILAYMAYIFAPNVRRKVTTLRVRVTCTCTHWAGPSYVANSSQFQKRVIFNTMASQSRKYQSRECLPQATPAGLQPWWARAMHKTLTLYGGPRSVASVH